MGRIIVALLTVGILAAGCTSIPSISKSQQAPWPSRVVDASRCKVDFGRVAYGDHDRKNKASAELIRWVQSKQPAVQRGTGPLPLLSDVSVSWPKPRGTIGPHFVSFISLPLFFLGAVPGPYNTRVDIQYVVRSPSDPNAFYSGRTTRKLSGRYRGWFFFRLVAKRSVRKQLEELLPEYAATTLLDDLYAQNHNIRAATSPRTDYVRRPEVLVRAPPRVELPVSAVNRWAVVVGVSKYQHEGKGGLTDLPFADDDASSFAAWLKKSGWSDNHVKVLLNENATERNIRIALEAWLTKAAKGDLIVLYWAGHGFPDPEDPEKVYFACHDTDIRVPATGYRMDRVREALEERRSKNVVVLADTCHAGKLVTRGERGMSIVSGLESMRKQKKVPKGWVFMVSADADRKAIEHSSWKNGAFTHCLLRGLEGKADGFQSTGAKDGTVTLAELRAYLQTSMPEETQKVLGTAKHPLITTSTGDPTIWNLTLQGK